MKSAVKIYFNSLLFSLFKIKIMKKIILILVIFVSSCKTSKEVSEINVDDALVHYSKSACLGKCPIYDLWVFENGSVFYKGIKYTSKIGSVNSRVSLDKIKSLEFLLKEADEFSKHEMNKIRDFPITTLEFNGHKIKFHSSRISGKLSAIDTLLKDIAESI